MQESEWMTTEQAAQLWHVSKRTARRYFDLLGAPTRRVPNEKGRLRLRRVLPIGTRPPVQLAGNPHFRKPGYQKALADRRWDGHITPQLKADYESYMLDMECERLLGDIELGMPPGDEDE